MNEFICVTDFYDGPKMLIPRHDVLEVQSLDDGGSRICYQTYLMNRRRFKRTWTCFAAKESIEEVAAMLNGGSITAQKDKGER